MKFNCTKGCKNGHCPCKESGGYCTSHCHTKRSCTNKEAADGDEECRVTGADDCDDINELKVKKNRKSVKTVKHKTEATMIKSVQSGDWLDDTHMDAASSRLFSQFPSLCVCIALARAELIISCYKRVLHSNT